MINVESTAHKHRTA